jgi:ribosome-associated heat shock protein Hsp15
VSRGATHDGDDAGQRLDKWLWAARFFKTRSAAATALRGGKVDVDGVKARPSRRVRAGTRLRISRGVSEFQVVVKAICAQRRPAGEAAALYEETPQSIAARNDQQARAQQAEHRRQLRLGRPDKHTRRELVRLKEQRE